jgi:CRP-like cAMP-binding protein
VPDLVRQSLSISLALDTVSAVTLFAGAERDFIAAIVTLCEPTTWVAVPGQWIVREGDMGDCMYFVHSGKLEVLREKEDGSMLMVRELGAGDYFGEMALFIATARRSASGIFLLLEI